MPFIIREENFRLSNKSLRISGRAIFLQFVKSNSEKITKFLRPLQNPTSRFYHRGNSYEDNSVQIYVTTYFESNKPTINRLTCFRFFQTISGYFPFFIRKFKNKLSEQNKDTDSKNKNQNKIYFRNFSRRKEEWICCRFCYFYQFGCIDYESLYVVATICCFAGTICQGRKIQLSSGKYTAHCNVPL